MEGYYSQDELLQFGFKNLGEKVLISKKASIYGAEQMSIGNNVRIDDFCFLVGNITLGNHIHLAPYASIHGSGGGSVELKDFCGLGSYSTIYAASDDYGGDALTNPSIVGKEFVNIIKSDIVLEKHATMGVHSVLLPGAYMAEGCALVATSLLNRETEPWGIYIGVPCKRIKERSRKMLELEKDFLNKNRGECKEVSEEK